MSLTPGQRELLDGARRVTLATTDPDGRPRLVPICFVVVDGPARIDAPDGSLTVWSPLDEKPKAVPDPRALARVRDVLARPAVSLLVDRWSEDWSELGWLRLHGEAALVEPAATPATVVAALRAKYPQYATHDLEARPMLAIQLTAARSWGRGLEAPGP